MKVPIFVVAACLGSIPALAQVDQVTTLPPNLVLSNYDSVPVGPYGGLEGSAYVARVSDPSATWFNPAGLARQVSAQISGSAGVYQRTSVSPEALPNQGGSIQQLRNFAGFAFSPKTRMTVAAAFVTTNGWNHETDSELFSAVPGGQQRFAYSADSDFEQRVLAVSLGYHRSGQRRFGGGLAFSMMTLRLVQSASDRIASAAWLQPCSCRPARPEAPCKCAPKPAPSTTRHDAGRRGRPRRQAGNNSAVPKGLCSYGTLI